MGRRLLFVGLLFLGAGVTSCATTDLSPIGREGTLRLHDDERRLWNMSEQEQKRLERSDLIYDDPVLTGYLNQVAQKLIPGDIKGKGPSFQIKVIKNPLLNAFAFPHGVIYVHTGFLARMENEAQLATVVAHEITHVIQRHTLREFRNMKNTAAFLATLQTAGIYAIVPPLLGSVGARAAVSGYAKELEAEADREGLDLMVRAGYDPREAAALFEHIKRDFEEQEIEEPFFFGTHPRLEERKSSYAELLQNKYLSEKKFKGTERFVGKILSLLLDNALLDLSMGRFSFAQESIQRCLQKEPQSARAHYYLGEVFRQRGEEGDTEKAEKEYLLSIRYTPSYPEPYKALGLVYYKRGEKEKARAQFQRYLSLAPDAKDKDYIEQYLQDIKQGSEGQ